MGWVDSYEVKGIVSHRVWPIWVVIMIVLGTTPVTTSSIRSTNQYGKSARVSPGNPYADLARKALNRTFENVASSASTIGHSAVTLKGKFQ
jgi:hypothetical protein